ncbi:peptidase M23 [Eikenella sp. NML96-A-049]|uniref:murein hydrolase activator EnvC family protein n=1 Tax=unclassified Eikenella TaxID=2639367 RepID=UPI0007DF95F0|nr:MULTISPECIES: peptidoglycan DD-metalloendopeptidase family protein [unclassified Eikenella]OAM34303.1 peptidase M23 [Eikenella sp. NML070372]OAM39048.1 peptidase M23 [Eikenella sp. NML96-A-049]
MKHKILILLALLCSILPAAAAPKDDLRQVQRAIGESNRKLQQQQSEQRQLQSNIRQTQSELDTVRRELDRLTRSRQTAWRELQAMQAKLDSLQTRIQNTQAQAARLLNSRYRNHQPNAVTLFLQNADPQQKGRHLEYLRHLNQANAQALSQLQHNRQELKQQQDSINEQLKRLDALKRQQQTTAARLGRQQQQQQRQQQSLEQDISRETAKLQTLRQNESRLNGLIASLSRRSAQRQEAERQRRAQALRQRRQQQAQNGNQPTPRPHKLPESERNEARQHDTPTPENPNRNTLTAEDLALEASEAQEPQSHGFSRMQGRLQRPASGNISGRFGQARPGGGTWKGLFISTPPTAVRSIAEGEVAYAAPLQGYGNTVIVDHGSGYLSIYTGLSQISAGAGSRVSPRQTIGRSGSLPDGENGLYFEIRYRNQAMNPTSWVN